MIAVIAFTRGRVPLDRDAQEVARGCAFGGKVPVLPDVRGGTSTRRGVDEVVTRYCDGV